MRCGNLALWSVAMANLKSIEIDLQNLHSNCLDAEEKPKHFLGGAAFTDELFQFYYSHRNQSRFPNRKYFFFSSRVRGTVCGGYNFLKLQWILWWPSEWDVLLNQDINALLNGQIVLFSHDDKTIVVLLIFLLLLLPLELISLFTTHDDVRHALAMLSHTTLLRLIECVNGHNSSKSTLCNWCLVQTFLRLGHTPPVPLQ